MSEEDVEFVAELYTMIGRGDDVGPGPPGRRGRLSSGSRAP